MKPIKWDIATQLLDTIFEIETGFLQVICSKIPRLFQSWNDNLTNLIGPITLSHFRNDTLYYKVKKPY